MTGIFSDKRSLDMLTIYGDYVVRVKSPDTTREILGGHQSARGKHP